MGDHAGIGCFVDSCLDCRCVIIFHHLRGNGFGNRVILGKIKSRSCKTGDEQGCAKMATFTFGGQAGNHGRIATDSGSTQGGYSKRMTVHRHFAVKVSKDKLSIW